MNRTKLKNYAPQARKDFIQAVTAKAAQYGLTAAKIEPIMEKGDVVLIAGKPFPKGVGDRRKRLEDRIKKHGFEQTIEAMAYTWFNRLVAIRYMELHGYLEHGFRVLSHPEGHAQPEIVEKAQYVDLPGLDQKKVVELKLDGTKEEDLYRLLLTAQFNALSNAMPFLFEKINDETELLLPDNLLNSDSLIRKLTSEIDEEDWKEVEIIGWLYQFYISDKKDEVIGKVVKSEDIPAATQLFTPNWIVKYLVQNTIGRQWLATYPQSSLRSKMQYYIEPTEQTSEVQEQLKAITPTSLNPEELTLLDPACGSGHILVEAYDLFKAIYEERGYRSKDIPALILQRNLFGLEIDDRAAQLAAFALMMKARADYPRIFDIEAQPNVVSFVESKGLDADEIHYALMSPLPSEKQIVEPQRPDGFLFETESNLFTLAEEVKAAQATANCMLPDISKENIAELITLFESAKTFGSLLQLPRKLAGKLPAIQERLNSVLAHGDLTHSAASGLAPMLKQAASLSRQYDAVVANPPYMGSKSMPSDLKALAAAYFPNCRADVFAMFMERCLQLVSKHGDVGYVTPYVWMFISSYSDFRAHLLANSAITTLIQLEYNAFEPACVPVCTLTIKRGMTHAYQAEFIRLSDFKGHQNQAPRTLEAVKDRKCSWRFRSTNQKFDRVPGRPICYWVSERIAECFQIGLPLGNAVNIRQGMSTGNGDLYIRRWYEVDRRSTALPFDDEAALNRDHCKWIPYNKGGRFRKWYGNKEFVLNFGDNGADILADVEAGRNRGFRMVSREFFYQSGVTWTDISSTYLAARLLGPGFIFENTGSMVFVKDVALESVVSFLCSKLSAYLMGILNPTMHFPVGELKKLPFIKSVASDPAIIRNTKTLCAIAKKDWDSSETSWDFGTLPIFEFEATTVAKSQELADANSLGQFTLMKSLEQANNQAFIDGYGLQGELTPEIEDEQITVNRPNRTEDVKRLLSYAIGCVMGRYSLDKPGLIYANSGNEGFDPTQYETFRADEDGITPVLELDWGIRDDTANRVFEFVSVAWPKEHLDENLKFIAESLTPSNGEQPKDTIRRYLATGFYKHHLSMYKKRPIYWLFSSGKQRAFQCLVYLHRYNEGSLARMRTEYVIPLIGKMTARLEHLQGPPEQKGTGGEIAATSAVTVKRKLEKERDNIKKQLAELQTFDEKLRHYADLRIKLDLDDGVKVNYGKFSDPQYGDILAEVKAICGTKEED